LPTLFRERYRRFPFLSGACVRADAATVLTALGVFGFASNLAATEATLPDVRSDLAKVKTPHIRRGHMGKPPPVDHFGNTALIESAEASCNLGLVEFGIFPKRLNLGGDFWREPWAFVTSTHAAKPFQA